MDPVQCPEVHQRGLANLKKLNHQGQLAVGGSTAMLDPFVGSSCNSLMLKLVEESVVGDGIKSFAEIKHQQVRSLPSIKSLGQIFYCIEQLHFS